MNQKLLPIYTVIAGVNGAGKTTLREKYNIDAFIIDVGSLAKIEKGYKRATKVANDTIEQYFKVRMSFGQESTLCGHTIINHILKAKNIGYEVVLLYVGIDSEETAISRVANRAKNGSHNIVESDIRRRYNKSLDAVSENKDLFSSILFFDNTGDKHISIAKYQDGKLNMLVQGEFKWLDYIFKKLNA